MSKYKARTASFLREDMIAAIDRQLAIDSLRDRRSFVLESFSNHDLRLVKDFIKSFPVDKEADSV